MSLLIRNATLLSGKSTDILVDGNKIAKIAPRITEKADEKLDASGKLALPGFINTHSHAGMALVRGTAEDMQLADWLAEVRKGETKFTPQHIHAGTSLACLEMIKGGTTCFSDMYFHMDEVARAAKESGIRATLAYCAVDYGNKTGTHESADEKKMKSELSIGEAFVKKWHGKEGGRIRCSIAPHSVYLCSAELLIAANKLSQKYSIPYHIHLSETRKEVFDCLAANGKRPAYYLDSLGVLSERAIAAHCVWLTKEEVKLLASKGVSSSLCTVCNMKLAGGGAAPLPEMQQFGMNISLGTDGPASNNSLSMFESMKFTGLLVKNSRWDATVAREADIFSAATAGGARALGMEAGEIKEGKLADIILIDKKAPNLVPANNNIANIVYSAHAGNVTDSIIDGKLVMQDRKLLLVDEEKIVDEAERQAEKLLG